MRRLRWPLRWCAGAGVLVPVWLAAATPQVPDTTVPQADAPAPVAAVDSAQAEAAVRRHRELGVRIAGLLADAERLRRQSSSLLTDLRKLDVERELQQARAQQAEASLSVIQLDLTALEQRVTRLSEAVARDTPIVAARLRRLQRLGRVGYARLVWGSSSAQTLGRAARLMEHLAREDSARLRGYRELTTQLDTAERRLQSRRDEAVQLRQTSATRLQAARTAAAERRQLLASIATERDQRQRVIDELERARAALDGAVAAYARTTGAPASTASRGAAPGDHPGPLTARRRALPWPLDGAIEQRFGRSRDPRFGTAVIRNGVDIAAASGDPVQAIHSGTVAFADQFEGFGRLVILDHGAQAYSLYGYLSSISVTRGAKVGAGEIVGHVGDAPTGGPSLYFELRVDGRPVDPLQWLQRR